MEKLLECEQKNLLSELTQGKEFTEQLRNYISPSSSLETRQFLIGRILSSYEKALSILSYTAPATQPKPTSTVLESANSSANISSKSEVCDQDYRDQSPKDVYKKRKTQPRWSEQVKVCSGTGIEGPLDDGYSWRKYGQKVILGANFPRGYYRCTHRHSQGCLAMKQVQRSDDDPTIFELTYRGRHTCAQSSNSAMPLKSLINDKPEQNKDHCQLPQQPEPEPEPKPKPSEETNFKFGGLQVSTNDMHSREDIFPSFSFPCASIGDEPDESIIFTESIIENIFLGNLSSSLMSPAAFDSIYFSISPCQMNSSGGGGGGQNVQTPESKLPTSVTNSSVGDLDVSINSVDFDASFPLDNLEFFVR